MKQRSNAIAAIDIGSTKVTVLVADVNEYGETHVLGVGVAPASGLSRGVIDNIQSARNAVAMAVEKAEQACGMRILSAVAGISGGHLSSQNNRGIVAIPDRSLPIAAEDRERAVEVAGQINIPTNRQVIHVIPRGYWIEGSDAVSDPVGMYGARLDAEAHIVTGAVSAVQNLTKCVEGAGVQLDEIVLGSLASALGALDEEERAQGVAAVDIGGSDTTICAFEDGAVAHTASLPLGGATSRRTWRGCCAAPGRAPSASSASTARRCPGRIRRTRRRRWRCAPSARTRRSAWPSRTWPTSCRRARRRFWRWWPSS